MAVDVDADEPAGHSDRLANTQSASLAPITAGGGATQAYNCSVGWWDCATVHQLLLLSHFYSCFVVAVVLTRKMFQSVYRSQSLEPAGECSLAFSSLCQRLFPQQGAETKT